MRNCSLTPNCSLSKRSLSPSLTVCTKMNFRLSEGVCDQILKKLQNERSQNINDSKFKFVCQKSLLKLDILYGLNKTANNSV